VAQDGQMKITTFNFGRTTYHTIQTVTVAPNGNRYSTVPEVTLDQFMEKYKIDRTALGLVANVGGRVILSRRHHLANGKVYDLELTLGVTRFGSKLCCEILMDVFVPETENYTAGIDFQQVDRFNIIL